MIATATEQPPRLPFAFAATCAAAALALYIFSGGLPKGPGRIHVRRIAWLALSTAISICIWKWRQPERVVDLSRKGYRNEETLEFEHSIPASQLFSWKGYAFHLRELRGHVESCLGRKQDLNHPYLGTDYCGAEDEAIARRAIYGDRDPLVAQVVPLLGRADAESRREMVDIFSRLPNQIWLRTWITRE